MRKQIFHRRIRRLGALLMLILIPAALQALEIISASPGRASPGEAVAVTGGPFTPETRVLLGDRTIQPTAVSQRRLVFTVPALEEGEYTLQLRDAQEASRSFVITIVAAAPRIDSLTPPNIDVCAPGDIPEVTVRGRHFQPGSSLLLDGKTVASSRLNSEAIAFEPHALAAGVYGVQVANPNGGVSVPHSLYVNDIPEILNVYMGEEFVNYYQLVIEGRNFFFNSTLLINEYPVGFFDQPPQQRVIPHQSSTSDPDKLASPPQSDNVRFVDCGTLVYNRYPYSSQPKQISLKIINPDGKASSASELFVP